MPFSAQCISIPKKGSDASENDDAFSPMSGEFDTEEFSCAIADGATESSFSAEWAKILVKAYACSELTTDNFSSRMIHLQECWKDEIGEKNLPWYAQQKFETGAFAAFVGLTIRPPHPGSNFASLRAIAVGDSCLFIVHQGEVTETFPLAEAEAFGDRPILIPSRAEYNSSLAKEAIMLYKALHPRDSIFYLMTDAIASWFMRECERDNSAVQKLEDIFGADGFEMIFEGYVNDLRSERELKNDDVTVIRLQID